MHDSLKRVTNTLPLLTGTICRMTLETVALLAFLSVNLKVIFLALPILPSHVSPQRLRITFLLHMALYKFFILYYIVLYCPVVRPVPINGRAMLAVRQADWTSSMTAVGQHADRAGESVPVSSNDHYTDAAAGGGGIK